MNRRTLPLVLVAILSGCESTTQPAQVPPAAHLTACTRSYIDADAHVAACYPVCPPDMEAYASATGQTFGRSASCAF